MVVARSPRRRVHISSHDTDDIPIIFWRLICVHNGQIQLSIGRSGNYLDDDGGDSFARHCCSVYGGDTFLVLGEGCKAPLRDNVAILHGGGFIMRCKPTMEVTLLRLQASAR
jgi:hypothetical protein